MADCRADIFDFSSHDADRTLVRGLLRLHSFYTNLVFGTDEIMYSLIPTRDEMSKHAKFFAKRADNLIQEQLK